MTLPDETGAADAGNHRSARADEPRSLASLGWSAAWEEAFAPWAERGLSPAKVVAQYGLYQIATGEAEFLAEVSGRFRHAAESSLDFPAVGDWVAVRTPQGATSLLGEARAQIHGVLPRQSRFVRKAAGLRTEPQVVAANVDTVLLVSALDGDFNPRRIERYLAAAWESGARPVLVLNKTDCCDDVEAVLAGLSPVATGVPVHPVCALSGRGFADLSGYLRRGETVSLIGSSGVGKSTLLNRILGEDAQRTAAVRESDDRGRHTTTHRELFVTPEGALVIDTPGMRELAVWDGEESLAEAFADIEELALSCQFRDCRHQKEPGCAVLEAVAEGTLPTERLESYRKLHREQTALKSRQDELARLQDKRRVKNATKAFNRFKPRG